MRNIVILERRREEIKENSGGLTSVWCTIISTLGSGQHMSKLNWENLSDTDCKKYTEITRTLLENIVVSDNIKCKSISCNNTRHVEAVFKLYDDIINCLKEASDKAFPSTSNRGYTTMPGWSEYVADLYKTSRDVREM